MTRKENLFKSTIKKTAIATMVVTGAVAPSIQTVFADTESDLQDAKTTLEQATKELEQAKAFVEKKHIDIENADYKELQKVKAALYRKGFSMDIINKALDSKGLFLDIIDN